MATKKRGKDRKKRKPRKTTATKKVKSATEPETVKPNIIRNIINAISEKVKAPEREGWSLDIGPHVESKVLGRHVFKGDDVVEIDLEKL